MIDKSYYRNSIVTSLLVYSIGVFHYPFFSFYLFIFGGVLAIKEHLVFDLLEHSHVVHMVSQLDILQL